MSRSALPKTLIRQCSDETVAQLCRACMTASRTVRASLDTRDYRLSDPGRTLFAQQAIAPHNPRFPPRVLSRGRQLFGNSRKALLLKT